MKKQTSMGDYSCQKKEMIYYIRIKQILNNVSYKMKNTNNTFKTLKRETPGASPFTI